MTTSTVRGGRSLRIVLYMPRSCRKEGNVPGCSLSSISILFETGWSAVNCWNEASGRGRRPGWLRAGAARMPGREETGEFGALA